MYFLSFLFFKQTKCSISIMILKKEQNRSNAYIVKSRYRQVSCNFVTKADESGSSIKIRCIVLMSMPSVPSERTGDRLAGRPRSVVIEDNCHIFREIDSVTILLCYNFPLGLAHEWFRTIIFKTGQVRVGLAHLGRIHRYPTRMGLMKKKFLIFTSNKNINLKLTIYLHEKVQNVFVQMTELMTSSYQQYIHSIALICILLCPMSHRNRPWYNEVPNRGAVEQSPLYVQKEFETDEEFGDEWEVSRSRVHLGGLIGSGAFGQVHAAQLDMPGGETITVAAKMLAENATEEEMQDFLGEIVMLKHVGSHKHVIRLIACCTRRAPLIALLEHAPRGDLLTLLRAARGRRREQGSSVTRRVNSDVHGRPSEADTEYTNLSDSDPALSDGKLYIEEETLKSRDHYVAEPALQLDSSTMREYALQVALGMKHLEERGITHRDLAARNILVDAAGVLKVADFGLSRSGVYVHTRSRPVPLRWLAPEAILHSQYCSASDVWAFAVLLWEIATLGGFPYSELSNHQVPPFLAGGGRLPKPARASPRLYELMVECWAEEPQDRPTFSSIVEKLSIQKQLYVDLDSLLASEEVSTFDDFEFSESEEVR
ncbi:hypothetical protein ABMA27_016772 [Loxostege sticticalis]|uniref:Protein kinase domain-containing protein n=1 Tax=Loxostege sticticalis TaxID=481309 RepID=A0ABR3I3K5_LOXSC